MQPSRNCMGISFLGRIWTPLLTSSTYIAFSHTNNTLLS
eukprot:UN04925